MTYLPLAAALIVAALLAVGWVRTRAALLEASRELGIERSDRDAMRRGLEHLAEGVVLLGGRSEVLYVNPAAISLLDAAPEAKAVGVPLAAFTSHQPLLALVDRTPPGQTVRQTFEFETSSDMRRSVEITLVAVGSGYRLLAIQDLRVGALVDKRRRDFVANASHELKTPIAALIGMLDLVEVVEEGKRAELLERARTNATGLANMTEDLLRLARVDDPDWKPTPELVDVDSLIEEVVGELQERADEKQLQLSVQGEPIELIADCFSLRTVIQNLVLNAVVYTREGRIDIESSQPSPGLVSIVVRDTGPGIDPEILPQIFERFFRGDVAHSRASGGTGLGLAIVRNMLRRMGGRISVRSEPGVGSEFTVELPTNPTRPLPAA